MAKDKSNPCESELVHLAESLGHLNRLCCCSTEAELRETIGDHTYEQLTSMIKEPIFHNVRAHSIQTMKNSVAFQKADIGYKLRLLDADVPEDSLAGYCLVA